jgi:hypothetical protein
VRIEKRTAHDGFQEAHFTTHARRVVDVAANELFEGDLLGPRIVHLQQPVAGLYG